MIPNNDSGPLCEHRRVWLLLPWYVNGTLRGSERSLAQRHLETCITCRKELLIQERLAAAIRHAHVLDFSSQASFSRLQQRITSRSPLYVADDTGLSRLRVWYRTWQDALVAFVSPRAAGMALPLLAVVVLALSTGFWLAPVTDKAPFRTLANPSSDPAPGINDLQVIFAKTIDRQQIKKLFESVHGKVVAGPTAIGVYTVNIASGTNDRVDMRAAIAQLRRHSGVTFAEPALPINTSAKGGGP